jgi:MinD-like ATPase involved in chromosome partitioning or flagellar assembly
VAGFRTGSIRPNEAVREAAPSPGSLVFDRPGGPQLAVCGLCGGAGASTLAYLVGALAARVSRAPILACDAGADTAGLEVYAGVASPLSLTELADCVALGERPKSPPFALADGGLRVLAAGPRPGIDGDSDGLERTLADAREAHGLCVLDCGTLARASQRATASRATHVAWVLPATAGGVERAGAALRAHARLASGKELVVARQDAAGRRPPLRELSELADERAAPLVLFAHVDDLAEAALDDAAEAAQVALEAIGALIAR